MGCPNGVCTGYELMNNLDFDTDGDGNANSSWTPGYSYVSVLDGKGT